MANEMGDTLPTVNLGTGRRVKGIAVATFHTCAIFDDAFGGILSIAPLSNGVENQGRVPLGFQFCLRARVQSRSLTQSD
jgi:hypothetical protein